ncbi:MAG TPA: SpoIIE family protein phosphatase [Dokdonella sp.]|uniref:ATP-binding SpoIIE family protein phosphatase n=1 Tax=Dokdonella sp. TaxID=2291710 RepID=UPI002D7ED3CA|nr:SpoIIE family protein phosphatase [Dokdonella sp.]HET9031372.1 SpoIIE family protein phosphatase [Dokdonella sp.]
MTSAPAIDPHVAVVSEALALAFLADLSETLAVSLDLRQTLSEAVTRIAEFMDAEAASLFLLDEDGKMLECKVCVGPIDIAGLRIPIGQGVVGRTVAENRSQVVADAVSDSRVDRSTDSDTGFVTRSLLCAPLATAKGPIGALEVVNKRTGGSFSADDAEILRLVAAPTSLAINNARMAHELVQQARMRREFDLARRMQKSLLPKRRRDGFPLLGVNLPAHEISGDFYDYFDLPDGRIGFFIGDVSGKGLDAALLMVRVASLLRWVGKDSTPPSEWLVRVNEELCQTSLDGRFVCALVGQCDRNAEHVEFAAAGFPPAMLYRDGEFTEFLSGGAPLGILSDMKFESQVVDLKGASLYCFSDGVTDVRDAQRRTIGSEGVRELISRHAGASAEPRLRGIFSELKQLRLVDDTTLLLIERMQVHGPEILLKRCFPAQPEQMREIRSLLRGALDDAGVETGIRDKLVLAVDEACCNIIRHAYGPEHSGDIDLRVTSENGKLEFRLLDSAPSVDPGRVRAKPLGECRSGGLGVALIDTVMDDWVLQKRPDDRGNRLIMHKKITVKKNNGEDRE